MAEEELKQLEELFDNLFNQLDTKETLKLIGENIKYYEEKGYNLSKFKRKYIQECKKNDQFKDFCYN